MFFLVASFFLFPRRAVISPQPSFFSCSTLFSSFHFIVAFGGENKTKHNNRSLSGLRLDRPASGYQTIPVLSQKS
jgi:hypothetical protein